ncbi:MAG: DUF885 domain-containing protein [Opitutaceae bacterium]
MSSRRFLVLLLGLASALPAAQRPAAPDGFEGWVNRLSAEWVRDPAAASDAAAGNGDDDEAGALWSEGVQARRDRRLRLAQDGLAGLARWPEAGLTPSQRISAAMLRWQLTRFVEGAAFTDHQNLSLFEQRRGLHVALVESLTERTSWSRPADVTRYLARLGRFAARLDEGLALARDSTRRGFVPPRFILERVETQLRMFLDHAPAANPLAATLGERMKGIDGLSAETRTEALAKARALVAEEIRPAYQRVLAWVEEVLPGAGQEAGWSRLPRGAEAYAAALRGFTTTDLGAAEIHAIGQQEVARLEAEAEAILRQLGYLEGTFNERMARATQGPLVEAADPRAAVIARYTEYIRDAEQRSEALFNRRPRAPVEVRRVPPLTERVASAYYTVPPPDGSRPGIFWVPLPGNVFFFGARMRSLAYHEAVPGHHFQLALQQEQRDLPRFRARRTFGGISAHSEGWGLYAERLAVEQGWYEGDPAGKLGAIGSELFRARRLVVDTGLHTLGWSRERAIAYGISAAEVERYITNPGQACSYMIGMLRILEIRERARAALGADFALPDFHDVVLTTGSVPLAVLEQVVADWTEARRKSAP